MPRRLGACCDVAFRQIVNDRDQHATRRRNVRNVDAIDTHLIDFFGERHELGLQRAALGRQVHVDIAAVCRQSLPSNIA